VFETAWEVREAAVLALKDRPRDEARPVLLEALRHPWPAAADHAAEALAALGDREAVRPLVDLLDQPDPAAPFRDSKGEWAVTELVALNHLRNCLLCHATSPSQDDPVRGPVPTPGEPLPRVYYDRAAAAGNFVRADITYLKQDFSLRLLAPLHEDWPARQRYDFVLRTRGLTKEEAADAGAGAADAPRRYPQREAVLFALRELTGADPGATSEEWRAYLARERRDPAP